MVWWERNLITYHVLLCQQPFLRDCLLSLGMLSFKQKRGGGEQLIKMILHALKL